jgi:hypothetical protein
MRESSKWLQKHGAFYKNMARSIQEILQHLYCRLLFEENIPLGRPLKFSHPNSEVAVHRTVGRPPG